MDCYDSKGCNGEECKQCEIYGIKVDNSPRTLVTSVM